MATRITRYLATRLCTFHISYHEGSNIRQQSLRIILKRCIAPQKKKKKKNLTIDICQKDLSIFRAILAIKCNLSTGDRCFPTPYFSLCTNFTHVPTHPSLLPNTLSCSLTWPHSLQLSDHIDAIPTVCSIMLSSAPFDPSTKP
jgi:hypothetical protein